MISGAAEQGLHRKSARLFNVYAMFVTAEMLQSIGETPTFTFRVSRKLTRLL